MSYTASYIVNSSSAQGTTDFQFTFPYIKEEHIEVFLNFSKITQGSGSAQYQVITNVSPKLIRLNTGIASANLRVEVRRNSSLGTPLVDYADGSTLTANDLDTSSLQSLYIDQELKDNQGKTVSVDEATGLPSMGESGTNLRLTNVADPTAAQDAATKNYVDTKVFTSAQIQDGTLVNADVNANAAIAGTKINPNFGSQNIVTTGTIDGRDVSVDGAKLDTCDTNAKDDQTAAEIRTAVEAASDSNVFTDDDHSKLNAIEPSATADQTNAEIRAAVEAASDSNVFTDADHTKLNSVESGATADQTITEIKSLIASSPLDASHLAANSVTTSEIADAELTTLAGMQSGTASILAGGTALAATTGEINAICDSKSVQTTISDTDNSYPTSGAVVDYVAAQIAPLGGLEVIANEDSFPTQPASGVVISIADAGGIVVNGSGVSTTARTSGNGSDNVTINGFPSTLYSTTLTDNMGLLVSSTGSSNTYTYHKLLGKESDIKSLSDDINDFNARYRVSASAPSSSLDDGDLWFDTTNDKMKVYNATGSSWDDVATVGDFFINTLSSSGNTGGGSATFNGTAYRFVLSSPPASAQQLIVSVNGVIQKPNTGSSQPSEGFAVSGNDIIFSAAPPSGADYFITTQGSAVSIGTPSDNTVSTAKLQNLAVTGDKIATNLDLADNKKIRFGTGNDLEIYHDGSDNYIKDAGTGKLRLLTDSFRISNAADSENMVAAEENGSVSIFYDNSKILETLANGIAVAGKVDLTNGHLYLDDNYAARFGTGEDLLIYHDGTHSYIDDTGTGNLKIKSNKIAIQSTAGEDCIVTNENGAVELYYDNSKKFETTSGGIQMTGHIVPATNNTYDLGTNSHRFRNLCIALDIDVSDNGKLLIGNDDDLQIYHDGTHNYIVSAGANGDNLIRSNYNKLQTPTGENCIETKLNGAVDIFYDNVKKFETTSQGIKITDGGPVLTVDATNNSSGLRINVEAQTTGELLRVQNDGTTKFQINHDGDVRINTTSAVGTGVNGAEFIASNGSELRCGLSGTGNGTQIRFYNGNGEVGSIRTNGSATAFNTSSDYRLKENEVAISDGITRLKTLKPYRFNFKADSSKTIDGFFAHEVTPTVPEAVSGEKDGTEMQAIDQSKLVPLLTAALQEAITKIETLETKVAALESA